MLWSRKATANVATSITAGDCVRSGRKTSRSISAESASTTAKQRRIAGPDRPAPLRGEREREGAGHDELAVREVDEAQHAEDEPDADRHQRVDRAERDAVGERLPVDVEDASVMRSTPPRARRCRPRRSGRASAAARRSRARGSGRRARPCAARAARRAARRARARESRRARRRRRRRSSARARATARRAAGRPARRRARARSQAAAAGRPRARRPGARGTPRRSGTARRRSRKPHRRRRACVAPARPSRRFSSTVSSREDPPALRARARPRCARRPRARARRATRRRAGRRRRRPARRP